MSHSSSPPPKQPNAPDNASSGRGLDLSGEELFRRAQVFHRDLFDDFPALIWMSGTDAKCDYFNQTWLAFRGRTMEQEMGDGWAEGVHPEDLKRCVDTYLKAFQARRPFEMEYRLQRHDGQYRWIVDVGRPFRDAKGQFGGYVGSCYDITDRKEAEKALARARDEWARTFDAVPDLIAILDTEHRIVGVNKAMAEKMGIRLEEAVGLRCYEHIHGLKAPPENCPHARMLASGKEQTQELYEERLGGHFLVTVSPLRNEQGQLIGSVHVARDITQQKEMEEIFRQHAALQIQQRLAQDLHDSTMQSLYAVGLGLESCRQLFKRNPDQALARLGRCVEELNSAMQDIRTHVMQLRSGKPADKSDTGKGALLTVDIPLQNTGTSS